MQASAQGLLGPDVQGLTAVSAGLPVFYGMPTFGVSSEKPSFGDSAASDPGNAGELRLRACPLQLHAGHADATYVQALHGLMMKVLFSAPKGEPRNSSTPFTCCC